ncbi:hypothetical protein GCM10010207_39220 [Streptomyces atratus]|nr:hypothetical protein GCM10010207_39220 [Streptomyces atratus]
MLSDKSRPVVAATLPVVGDHIGEIAQRFYRHLFDEHPELIDGVFNRGNQVHGHQQQALAGSVAAFATTLLETPERVPEQLLRRIAHKHASLGIRPDQYQVVHDNLMWAIGDVLGDAVTPEVAAAWDEVYWLMANALINQERGLYSARGGPAGDGVAGLAGGAEGPGGRRCGDLRGQADRRPPGEDLTARPVRHRADADARRQAPAPPVQLDPGRRRGAPPVLGQAGKRRGR